jgi:hypothetical protein
VGNEANITIPDDGHAHTTTSISGLLLADMGDSDHGDVEWDTGVAYVQAATIADTVYASCYVGLFQGATGNNEPFYTDGALTYDATSGTLAATAFTGSGAGLTMASTDLTDTANILYEAELDTFAELDAQIADKTLVNEEDAVTWDALGTFNLGITIAAGDPLMLGAVRWDNGSNKIDGEQIANDTIDDDSIDFSNVTGADLTLTDCGNITSTGNVNLGGADLEIPQASPAVPDVDGEIEYDMTDGKLVIQHGSAHAELGGSTDVAVTGLIKSFGGTIFAPDTVNDVITVKAVNSIEFPHGVVITGVYLGIASDTTYTLTVQNFDDFDTINGANPTIDTVTYTADTTGEIIDSTPTYATIAAGQIIMISIPATDVDWIHFEIYYYEPAA